MENIVLGIVVVLITLVFPVGGLIWMRLRPVAPREYEPFGHGDPRITKVARKLYEEEVQKVRQKDLSEKSEEGDKPSSSPEGRNPALEMLLSGVIT